MVHMCKIWAFLWSCLACVCFPQQGSIMPSAQLIPSWLKKETLSTYSVTWMTPRSICVPTLWTGRGESGWSTRTGTGRKTNWTRCLSTETGWPLNLKAWAKGTWRCGSPQSSRLTADCTDVMFPNCRPAVTSPSVLVGALNTLQSDSVKYHF